MKKRIGLSACIILLTGCQTAHTVTEQSPRIGMANPASVYCVEQGGKLEIRNTAQGQVGYCQLPNGQVIEEWSLFRANQQQCLTEKAQTLIGQTMQKVEDIQTLTQAKIVRVVEPNQPVTMDYREDRITLVVNPQTQKIERASCG